jgi:hypothetical protein
LGCGRKKNGLVLGQIWDRTGHSQAFERGASPRLFTIDHLQHIEALIGLKVERVVEVKSQIDTEQPLVPQVVALADKAGLSPAEW